MEIENNIYIKKDDTISVGAQGLLGSDGSEMNLVIDLYSDDNTVSTGIWIPLSRKQELLDKLSAIL